MHILSLPRRRIGTFLALVLGLVLGGVGAGHAAESSHTYTVSQASGDSAGSAENDTAITAQVRAKVAGSAPLSGSDINIDTTNGVVTLTGTVKDAQEKDQAAQLAGQVEGVKTVDNQLNVGGGTIARGEQELRDSWITTKVKYKLMTYSPRQAFKVDVSTVNGVVILKGTLPDAQDVQQVTQLAGQVEGVKSVDVAGLTVSSG